MAEEAKYAIDEENSAWRIVDGEAVIINAETTFYYGLNGSATRVWQALLDDDLSAEEIAARLAPEYSHSAEEITADIQALLRRLVDEQLLKGEGTDGTVAPTEDASGGDGDESEDAWAPPEMTRYDTLEDLIVCGE